MEDIFKLLEKKKIILPEDVDILLKNCIKLTVFDSVEQLKIAAVNVIRFILLLYYIFK